MQAILQIFTLLGALGLFLYGMTLMSEGLQKAAGDRLRAFLASMTSNAFKRVLTGLLITAIIQSSSATTVMVVSFVNAGLLSLTNAIGVIMGANIGTTVTAWLISLLGFSADISLLAIPLIAVGFVFFMSKKSKRKSIGEFIIGFALLFMGLAALKDSVPDLGSHPEALAFIQKWTDFGFGSVLIFVLLGTLLTIVLQSSSATMALTLVMVNFGWIPFEIAAAMVLGENIGTTITANIAAAVGNVSAKRAAMAHTVFNVTGVFSDFQHTIFYAPEIIYRIDLLEDIDSPLVKNGNGSTLTFMQLAEGADVRELEKRTSAVVNKEDFLYLHGICKEFILTPFSEINSCGVETTIPFEGVVNADFVSLFVAAGLFLLFFAVLNYISLTVAQTGFRAKEMASRRLLGTQRTGIIVRYIAESFILTLFSFTLALLLVYLVSPNLSELIGKNVDPFRNMGRIGLLFMVLMLVLLSLLSGIIPALLVSGYKPIDVVRGNFARASKITLGKILVGFQSGVAFITLVLAVVMFIQLKHMTDKPMGYERDNRICIQNASKLSDYHVEELKSLACVEKTGWVQFEPMTLGISGTSFRINGIDCKFDIYFGNQAAFDILGFKVLRKTGEPLGYSAWLPESTMRALGLDYDCTQIDFDNGSYISVCGIIKDYQKGTSESSEKTGFLNLAWIKEMEKEEDSKALKSCSTVIFSMDSAFSPFCFGFLTFFFLTGCIWGERLSESESQSLSRKS